MARMEVKYIIQEENEVGVENVKEGSLFMPFKINGDPEKLADELGKTFKAELEDIENQQQILKVDKQLMDLELSPDKDVSVLKNLPPIKKE